MDLFFTPITKSQKGRELKKSQFNINFYWPSLERQVRIMNN